jgi:hypothetical protein
MLNEWREQGWELVDNESNAQESTQIAKVGALAFRGQLRWRSQRSATGSGMRKVGFATRQALALKPFPVLGRQVKSQRMIHESKPSPKQPVSWSRSATVG